MSGHGDISKDEMMHILMTLGNDKFLRIHTALNLQESIQARIDFNKNSITDTTKNKSFLKLCKEETKYLEKLLEAAKK